MFTVDDRDRVLRDLIALAKAAPDVSAAAVTGSTATGTADRWSDIDLALAVWGPLDSAIDRWTDLLVSDFGVLHYWDLHDLHAGAPVFRVFLLPGGLEVDLGFYPEGGFGPRGPAWRPVFGAADAAEPAPPPNRSEAVGLAWHHILHARTALERGRHWQAEHWISASRTQLITLAGHRLGFPGSYAKNAHLLPDDVAARLADTLVRRLDESELRRALRAVVAGLEAELQDTDPVLAAKLAPMLAEVVAAG